MEQLYKRTRRRLYVVQLIHSSTAVSKLVSVQRLRCDSTTLRERYRRSASFVHQRRTRYAFVYSFIAYGSSKNWIRHYKSKPIHWQSHHINHIMNRIKKNQRTKNAGHIVVCRFHNTTCVRGFCHCVRAWQQMQIWTPVDVELIAGTPHVVHGRYIDCVGQHSCR